MNTWCNQRHNVPFVFPETQQSDNFIPAFNSFNFAPAALGQTTVSFAAFDPHAPSQYIQQWSLSIAKSLGSETTLEIGYLGSSGLHLQRSHLINKAPPGPGPLGLRRPFRTLSFLPGKDRAPPIAGSIRRPSQRLRPSHSEMWDGTQSSDPVCKRSIWP